MTLLRNLAVDEERMSDFSCLGSLLFVSFSALKMLLEGDLADKEPAQPVPRVSLLEHMDDYCRRIV